MAHMGQESGFDGPGRLGLGQGVGPLLFQGLVGRDVAKHHLDRAVLLVQQPEGHGHGQIDAVGPAVAPVHVARPAVQGRPVVVAWRDRGLVVWMHDVGHVGPDQAFAVITKQGKSHGVGLKDAAGRVADQDAHGRLFKKQPPIPGIVRSVGAGRVPGVAGGWGWLFRAGHGGVTDPGELGVCESVIGRSAKPYLGQHNMRGRPFGKSRPTPPPEDSDVFLG